MNIKKATNSSLSTTESKNITYANKQNRNRSIGMEIIWRVISWEGKGEKGERVQESRSLFGRNKIDRGS